MGLDSLFSTDGDRMLTYDDAGRLVADTVTGGLATVYTLDNLGRVTQATDNSDRYIKYAYNSRGWVTSTTLSDPTIAELEDGPQTTFTYNATGQLLTETNARGYVTAHAYDDRSLLTQTTLADPGGRASSPVQSMPTPTTASAE